jgi:hypothetical protein
MDDNIHEAYSAYFAMHDEAICDIWRQAKKAKDTDRYPWTTISLSRAKKIWRDYSKLGIVRDERGINDLAEEIIDKIVKIDAMTILMGHTPTCPKSLIKELELDYDEETDERMCTFLIDEQSGQWRISDYGLDKLQTIAIKLLMTTVPEERLLLIDQVFNVVHQRSDMASWFVKGGRMALEELSNQEVTNEK